MCILPMLVLFKNIYYLYSQLVLLHICLHHLDLRDGLSGGGAPRPHPTAVLGIHRRFTRLQGRPRGGLHGLYSVAAGGL